MSKYPIPDEVKRFILVNISSVPYLETLLLLRKEADTAWNSKSVARRIYINESLANDMLKQLLAAGVVFVEDTESNTYRYASDNHFAGMIDLLAHSYAKNLVDVTMLIHAKTGKKAQQFADAFKLRKD